MIQHPAIAESKADIMEKLQCVFASVKLGGFLGKMITISMVKIRINYILFAY